MEFRHLRYFLAVADQQIARLEAELGTPLFFRTSRKVRLTPAGEVLRPPATRILVDVDHAAGEMSALAGVEKGRLRLGIIQTGAGAIDIIALISAYHGRYPGIELHIQTEASTGMAAVAAGELDVAIVALPRAALPPELTYNPIVDDPLVAAMSRQAARGVGDEVSLAGLLERGPFIHYRRGSGLRRSITAAFDRSIRLIRAK